MSITAELARELAKNSIMSHVQHATASFLCNARENIEMKARSGLNNTDLKADKLVDVKKVTESLKEDGFQVTYIGESGNFSLFHISW